MSAEEPPKVIYLQFFNEDCEVRDVEEITWCEDEMFDGDIRYVREDKKMSAEEKDCGCQVEHQIGGYVFLDDTGCAYYSLAKDHAAALATIERLKAELATEVSTRAAIISRLENRLAEIDRVYGIKNVVTKEITGITLNDHKHRWARRRDGRACADCGQVEFGDFSVKE